MTGRLRGELARTQRGPGRAIKGGRCVVHDDGQERGVHSSKGVPGKGEKAGS